jgi:hypothetical protein
VLIFWKRYSEMIVSFLIEQDLLLLDRVTILILFFLFFGPFLFRFWLFFFLLLFWRLLSFF